MYEQRTYKAWIIFILEYCMKRENVAETNYFMLILKKQNLLPTFTLTHNLNNKPDGFQKTKAMSKNCE